jgi:hypothetical protein
MMSFTHPAALWALTGLAIPLVIHLLSRKEGKIIRIGSLRHLEETSTRQFKGIRLNELMLLALRSLIILAVVALMAGLQWTDSLSKQWVLVEPGLENNPLVKPTLDSLRLQGYEQHSLSTGFPTEHANDSSSHTNYNDLLHALASEALLDGIVFSFSNLSATLGTSVSLPPHIRWISVAASPKEFVLTRVQHTPDSVATRMGYTSSQETYFNTVLQPGVARKADIPPTVSILLIHDEKYRYDAAIMRAALTTIEQSLPVTFVVKEKASSGEWYDWCIALGGVGVPPKGVHTLRLQVSPNRPLLHRVAVNEWELTKRLNPETAVQENLAIQLAGLLIPEQPLQKIAQQHDRRMMPEQMLWSPTPAEETNRMAQQAAAPFAWIFLIVLLITERFLAYQRNQ